MTTSALKKGRVVVSLVFLVAFILTFLDFRRIIPESAINTVTWLQFIPSLLKFFNVFTLGAAGFLVVIVLTLVFGRVYCSSVCPLGIVQDVISWTVKKFKKKRKRYFSFTKAWNKLRYGILVVTILSFVFGTVLLVNLLDPYSSFGRIFTFFGKPVVIGLNNLLSGLLAKIDVFTLFPVEIKPIPILVMSIQLFILGLVLWLSIFHGRLYCNTFCPVGTLLGFLSRFSLFRIRIDSSTCTHCGLCGLVCKASCLSTKDQVVDLSRCIYCFNCLTVCDSHSVIYGLPEGKKNKSVNENTDSKVMEGTDLSKRKFILGSAAFALGMAGFSYAQETPVNEKPTEIPEEREFPVCPPGATGIEVYNNRCTACNLCVSACPSDVLQPAFMEYGLAGIMQPRMDYWLGYCNFECTRCLDVCPTGALLPMKLEDKQLLQIGIAQFIKENCIVHTDKTDCGACSEHCPTKAVHMVPYEGTLVIPEVDDKICIGCGACEFACPTTPYKAIFVDGNFEHKIAEKPLEEEIIKPDDTEDFPF